MNLVRLVVNESRYDGKAFWRDPQAVFFTVGLPLLYLFIFVTIFGDEVTKAYGLPVEVKSSTVLVPGIVGIAIVSTAFQSLAIAIVTDRERGMLKRLRATPVPPSAFIAGHVITTVATCIVLTAVLLVLGRAIWGVQIPTDTLPALALAVTVGAAAMCCIAFAFTALLKRATAAAPMAAAASLTLFFISGNFFSVADVPGWLRFAADVFPVKHLNEALFAALYPQTRGTGIEGADLLVIALWGVAALVLGARRFRWTPTAVE
jgi:ABC-2 type transport system permease protein